MANSNVMPEFKNPPVSEVALSVEFSPLENWTSSHGLSFGSIIKAEYPNIELQLPLISEIEKFGDALWQQNQMKLEVMNQNSNRFWFMTDPSNWLIQIQQDRFVVNWRKVSGEEEYPRYEKTIRSRFVLELERFLKFVEENNIGTIKVTQCEVTYVNDIPHGEYWKTITEATELFSMITKNNNANFLGALESFSMTGSYLMPNAQGRLRYSINHALRSIDKKEVLKMNLIARGRPASSDKDAIVSWVDMGREWIVKGFEDLTSKKAHALWGKKE